VQIPQFDWSLLTLDNILAFVTKYGVLISGTVAAFGFIYGLYKNSQTNKTLQQLASIKENANSEVNSLLTQLDTVNNRNEELEAKFQNLPKTDLDALTEAQNELVSLRSDYNRVLAQLQQQNTMLVPSESDMTEKLRRLGYEVKKPVSIA
jgi:predicted transcriptional regulator